MENDSLTRWRRKRLKDWIQNEFGGNASEFARQAGKPQGQISGMLNGPRAFGEKIARELESAPGTRLPKGYFFRDDEPPPPITRAGYLLAADWEKLEPKDRLEIERDVQRRLAQSNPIERARERREPPAA